MDPDDIWDMPAHRFFSFAMRLVAYKGAVRMTAQKEHDESSSSSGSAPNNASRASRTDSRAVKHFNDVEHNLELAPYFD